MHIGDNQGAKITGISLKAIREFWPHHREFEGIEQATRMDLAMPCSQRIDVGVQNA